MIHCNVLQYNALLYASLFLTCAIYWHIFLQGPNSWSLQSLERRQCTRVHRIFEEPVLQVSLLSVSWPALKSDTTFHFIVLYCNPCSRRFCSEVGEGCTVLAFATCLLVRAGFSFIWFFFSLPAIQVGTQWKWTSSQTHQSNHLTLVSNTPWVIIGFQVRQMLSFH